MKEFFGIGGYQRPAEGFFSWQHLLFVTSLMIVMVIFAALLGRKNRSLSDKKKNRVLIFAAILIDSLELFKIILACAQDAAAWKMQLPLFLCSIQLITIPLAAFSKGRIKAASMDFVAIFGILGAVMGTYFAGQNYACYPVLSFDNVVSAITHSISGFTALYLLIIGMTQMKKENMVITFGILIGFCVAAYIANIVLDYNYMFLMRGDGTPYDILFNLVKGNAIAYPIGVAVLFLLYIMAFYGVFYLIKGKKKSPVTP